MMVDIEKLRADLSINARRACPTAAGVKPIWRSAHRRSAMSHKAIEAFVAHGSPLSGAASVMGYLIGRVRTKC